MHLSRYCCVLTTLGKDGNFREYVNSGKLWESEMYSGNSCISDVIVCGAI